MQSATQALKKQTRPTGGICPLEERGGGGGSVRGRNRELSQGATRDRTAGAKEALLIPSVTSQEEGGGLRLEGAELLPLRHGPVPAWSQPKLCQTPMETAWVFFSGGLGTGSRSVPGFDEARSPAQTTRGRSKINSIAVLPFENLSDKQTRVLRLDV